MNIDLIKGRFGIVLTISSSDAPIINYTLSEKEAKYLIAKLEMLLEEK